MELLRENNSVILATGAVLALYGLYTYKTATKKQEEKRVKGLIEAVVGAIVFVVALLVK